MAGAASILGSLLGLIGGGFGVAESAQNSDVAQQAAREQNAIAAAQEAINAQSQAQKLKILQQLFPFFSQYLEPGSPFLQRIQASSAEQNAKQFGNVAGQLRQNMQTSGLGYGPSGATASALGQLGTEAATSSADTYLKNLLANEQMKFQTAQGIQGLGSMFNFGPQNMPTTQPVQTTTGSSVGALGQVLQNLLKQGGGGTSTPTTGPYTPGFPPGPYAPGYTPGTTQGTAPGDVNT